MRPYLLILILLQCLATAGQFYPRDRYSAAEGLSHSNVFRIMQDRRGFLWLSTNYGVSKFDGKTFQNFTGKSGLKNTVIMSVSERTNGDLLISSLDGLYYYRGDTIRLLPVSSQLPRRVIYTREFNSRVYCIALRSIYEAYTIFKGSAQQLKLNDSTGRPVSIRKMYLDNRLGMVFLSDDGVYHVDAADRLQPIFRHLVRGKVHAFISDGAGGYWVGYGNHVVRISGGKITRTLQLDGSDVADLEIDKENRLWIVTPSRGVTIATDASEKNISEELGLKNIIINDIFRDQEGSMWMASHGDGLYRVGSLNQLNYLPDEGLLNVYAKSVSDGTAGTWIGSMGTVSLFKNGILKQQPLKYLLSTDFIYFTRQSGNRLFVGIPTGVIIKELPFGRETFVKVPGGLSFHASGDSIMIGSFNRLGMITAEGGYLPIDLPLLEGRRINSIIQRGKRTYLGTDSGIFFLQDGLVQHLPVPPAPAAYVNQLFFDQEGRFWAATDQGLLLYSESKWYLKTDEEGLSHIKCNTIVQDEKGAIWVGTQSGLNLINSTGLITQHNSGLDPNEVLSLHTAADGKLIIGTVNGVSIHTQTDRQIAITPPPLYITSVVYPGKNVSFPSNIHLHSDVSRITINYIGISYGSSASVEYRYQIEGVEKSWSYTRNTSVDLSLPAGKYVFLIETRQNKGAWGKRIALPLSIEAPFWKRTWFIISMVVIAVTAVSQALRIRSVRKLHQQAQEREIKSQLIHLRQQALNALINPHFIFNCLNSIQHYLNKNDKDMANKYLASFGKLIRLTLEHSNRTFINLSEEIRRISLYLELERLRCGEKLSYEIITDAHLNSGAILIPNMVLQPYIENAVWHGIIPLEGNGLISVRISQIEKDMLQIEIEDNGVGISKATTNKTHNRTSFGMKLNEERLQLLTKSMGGAAHFEVHVTDKNITGQRGTIVRLLIPKINVTVNSRPDPVFAPINDSKG